MVEQLAGAPLPASALESLILPARLPGYTPALLDELTAAGEVTWTGCGPLAGTDGWLAVAPADVADLLLPDPEPDVAATPLHRALLAALGWPDLEAAPVGGGALFFRELADRAGRALTDCGRAGPGRRRGGHRDLGPGLGRAAQQRHAGPAAGPAGRPDRGRRRRPPAAPLRPPRPLRPAAGRAPGAAQPERAAVGAAGGGRWPRLAGTRPDPARARPGGGAAGTARGAHPGRAGHRTGHRWVRRRCTGCCGPWRTPAGRAAATSWRGSARPSSRCPGAIDRLRACPGRTAPRPAPVGRARRRARRSATSRPHPGGRYRRVGRPRPGGAGRRRPGPALRRRAGLAGDRRRHQTPAGAQGGCAGGAGGGCARALRGTRRSVAAVVQRRPGRADRGGAGAGRGRARGLAGDAGRGTRGRGGLARVGAGRGADRGRVPGDPEGAAAAGVEPAARRGGDRDPRYRRACPRATPCTSPASGCGPRSPAHQLVRGELRHPRLVEHDLAGPHRARRRLRRQAPVHPLRRRPQPAQPLPDGRLLAPLPAGHVLAATGVRGPRGAGHRGPGGRRVRAARPGAAAHRARRPAGRAPRAGPARRRTGTTGTPPRRCAGSPPAPTTSSGWCCSNSG